MYEFRSFQNRPSPEHLHFSRFSNEFAYDEKLKRRVKVGQKDIVAFIDSPREDCEVYTKILRYNNGDLTALGGGSAKGIYTDVSGLPTDYNTIMNSVKRANEIVSQSGKKSIADYINSAFEQIRMEMSSKPTLESPIPPVDNSDVKEPITNEK